MAQKVSDYITTLKSRKTTQALLRNWPLKLLSLLIAIVIWYFVAGEDQVDMTILVPIEIVNLPSNLIISNQYKKDIEVTVRGPQRMIQDLRNRNITRQVNLSKADPGTTVLENDARSINLPRGIAVLRLQPTSITLLLDELVEKTFPIKPMTHGAVDKEYLLQGVSLTPSELSITGPKSVLETAEELHTYVIDLDGLNHTTTLQVNLNLSPAFIRLIGETVVTAAINVRDKMVEQTIRNIPVNVRETELAARTEPETITVTASLPVNLVRNTPEPAILFRAYVSPGELHQPKNLPVTVNAINVPEHESITILSVRPPNVMVIPENKHGTSEKR